MVRTIVVYVLHINDHMNVYLTYFHMKRVYLFNIILNCVHFERLFTFSDAPAWKTAVAVVQSTLSGGSLCHATRLDWLLISWPKPPWWTVTSTSPMSVSRPIRIQHAIGSRVLIGCPLAGRLYCAPASVGSLKVEICRWRDVTTVWYARLNIIYYFFTAFGTKVNFCHSMYF